MPDVDLKLLGGAPALDFVNTIDPRFGPDAFDRLDSPSAVAEWARLAGLPRGRVGDFDRALTLRDALDRIFRAVARGKRPPGRALGALREEYVAAISTGRLVRANGGYRWRVDSILWPVLESAIELLDSPALARVKECPADDCGWLFLDGSRNATRRWCSMDGCGAKAKMRRYRRRMRGATVSR